MVHFIMVHSIVRPFSPSGPLRRAAVHATPQGLIVAGLLLSACESSSTRADHPEAKSPPPRSEPSATDPAAPNVASADSTSRPKEVAPSLPAGVHCIEPEGFTDFTHGTRLFDRRVPLSVVRVAQDDVLHVRASPDSSSPSIFQLPADARNLVSTDHVCFVDETPWYRLELSDDQVGWASGKFLRPTTLPKDATTKYRALLTDPNGTSPDQLAKTVASAISTRLAARGEGRNETQVLSTATQEQRGSASVYSCCELDDSIAGEQALLTFERTGTTWKVKRVEARTVCYRGVSEDQSRCL